MSVPATSSLERVPLRHATTPETTCAAPGCDQPLARAVTGRPARFCSQACRALLTGRASGTRPSRSASRSIWVRPVLGDVLLTKRGWSAYAVADARSS